MRFADKLMSNPEQHVTLMVKIRGWWDEEKWVGSKFGACMWIYTKEALIGGQMVLCFAHLWFLLVFSLITNGLSSRTLIQPEEEILSIALDFQSRSPVRCTMEPFGVFGNLNRFLGTWFGNQQVSDFEVIVTPFGEDRTQRSCMLTSEASVPTPHTHKKVWSKQRVGKMDWKLWSVLT